ncbi:hypothetical protein D3C87_1465530 [compost metagenome]
MVDALDAHAGILDRQPIAIDGLVLGDDAGQRAQARRDARRGGVEPVRERLDEHGGVEFPGLAIDVEIGAGKMRPQQGRAQMRRAGKELIDKGIFGLADREMIEPGHGQEPGRIDTPGMGRVENHGRHEPPGTYSFECRLIPIVGPHAGSPKPAIIVSLAVIVELMPGLSPKPRSSSGRPMRKCGAWRTECPECRTNANSAENRPEWSARGCESGRVA